MDSTKMILLGGIVIISVGVVNATINNRPETPVFAGGIGVLVLASLLDAIGPGPGKIAAAIVALAATTAVFVEAPSLFQAIQNSQSQKKKGK